MTGEERILDEIAECEVDLEVHKFFVSEINKRSKKELTQQDSESLAYSEEEVPKIKKRLEKLKEQLSTPN